MEIIKKSNKSICHKCINVNELCMSRVSITCGTDSAIGMAYVQKCNFFNREIVSIEYKKKTVKTSHATDSRVEMMGGGHDDPEV